MPADVLPFPVQQPSKGLTMKQIVMLGAIVAGVLLAVDFANNALGNPLSRLGIAA
jgi:hypothetical protein